MGHKAILRCVAIALAVIVLYTVVTGDLGLRRAFRQPLVYECLAESNGTPWHVTGYQQPDFLWQGKCWVLAVTASVEPGSVCSVRFDQAGAGTCLPCGEVGDRKREVRVFYSHDYTNVPSGVDPSTPPRHLSLVCDGVKSEWELKSPGR